ncbi:B3 domain-containing protein Os01g0905400-like [Solanum dulcamara]|uniref:B3 domain-containing protein Os01g0905400-like n=1 Tax=Solanum dulcamara TaxID=45834 RepID=UPI002485EF82|nr:B3 domain-containing protein Os01g0905400-like [Solanum dulcamara]XP_055826822.1 B3 domain-containing protein Os01g0905400-like [Solanum dulcamara]XP_055826823.1 B3 domain-containing protein Os01g0905400-like [Solanum dulcamara]XP_055826824.1 B3 domain-containing protein Os01g0905400-like [Solanum dulcamara]
MECENEACDGCKKDCLLIHGKGVLSFFKVMIDKRFLQVLYFPPKFARSVSHLTDQETYLEDSNGQRWRVTVCNHNGSLSIRQGWPKFSSDHGLDVGDFLVFHYVPGQHFIVQIFGTSGCEKMKSCSDIGNGRKRARTYPEATIPAELFQTTDINSIKKKSKTSAESESEKVAYKPSIANFATNIDADTGKGQSVHSAIDVDESFCMIDRSSQYDQGDDRLCLHLSSFEMPASKPLAEGTNNPFKGHIGKDNHVETNLRSLTEPNLNVEIDNLNSEALLSKLETGITATNMVSSPAEDIPLPYPKYKKSNEASQFAREARLVKKEFEEITTEAFSPARAIHRGEYANGNEKVIKSEPADSGDTPSLNAVSYSCLLEIDGRDFLELPESWQKYFLQRAKQGRIIIYLRGPDKRIWPTFYHCRSGFNVLTCGWKQVTAVYGLNPGDECLFQLVNQPRRIFDVRKL